MEKLLIEQVKDIVKDAAQIALNDKYQVKSKTDVTNVVTSSDVKIQEFLQKRLTELVPGSDFFGEESEGSFKDKGYTWVVDPIDGTQNFIRGLRQSTISVCLCFDGQAIIGVVYNPFIDEMYWAEKGKGSYCNGTKLAVSDRKFDNAILCTAMSLYDKRYAATCNDIIMDAYYKCNDVRRFGTASIELCYLAAGKVELYYEYRLWPWDHAAAGLVLTEAGGFIEDPFIGDKIEYYHMCPVVAANTKENLAVLHDIVRKYMHNVPYLE